jgi:hypothetical protein
MAIDFRHFTQLNLWADPVISSHVNSSEKIKNYNLYWGLVYFEKRRNTLQYLSKNRKICRNDMKIFNYSPIIIMKLNPIVKAC